MNSAIRSAFAAVAVLQLASQIDSSPTPNCSCLCVIKKLAKYDGPLGERSEAKKQIASTAANETDFVNALKKRGKHAAEASRSGSTMSWISETFEGIESQYSEYKHGRRGNGSGYLNYIGKQVIDLFNEHKKAPKRVIYNLQNLGAIHHALAVEQIPNGVGEGKPGYRIYQSYSGVFTLRAWLAPAITDEFYVRDDFRAPQISACIKNPDLENTEDCGKLKEAIAKIKSLAADAADQPAGKSFLQAVTDQNQTTVKSKFETAWAKFGKAKLLSEAEFFGSFLAKVADISQYLNETVTTAQPFNEAIYNDWIGLYGDADPHFFPGIPANALNATFKPVEYPSQYALEIKAVQLQYENEEELNARCRKNAYILKESISL